MTHKNEGKTIYSTHNPDNTIECYTDGYDRQKVIDATRDYFEERAFDDGEYGDGERDVILTTHIWDTGEETEETITIEWCAEKPFDPQREWGTWHKGAGGVL